MTATLKCWYSFEIRLWRTPRGLNAHRRLHKSIRVGEDVKVRRSPQAAACRKRDVEELGRPHRLLRVGSVGGWWTAIEAREETRKRRLYRNRSGDGEHVAGRRRSTVTGKARRMPLGSLITHRTPRVGKPRTWGRT